MTKTRHTEEQVAFAPNQAEAEVIRRMGISEQTSTAGAEAPVGCQAKAGLARDDDRGMAQLSDGKTRD